MNGLISKLEHEEFIEFVNQYDIICLTETKTDNCDCIEIDGYTTFAKHRTELSTRKSGGIIVYVRNKYIKYCSVLKAQSKHVLWININDNLFKTGHHLLLGAVYIPPSNSKYSSSELFDDIENRFYPSRLMIFNNN